MRDIETKDATGPATNSNALDPKAVATILQDRVETLEHALQSLKGFADYLTTKTAKKGARRPPATKQRNRENARISKRESGFCPVAKVEIALAPDNTLRTNWESLVLEDDSDEGMPREMFGLLARYGLNLPLPTGKNAEVRLSDEDAEIIRSNRGEFVV